MLFRLTPWLAATIASVLLLQGCSAMPVEFDLVIRGGSVVDGTGAPRRVADVGISGDRIAEIGDLAGRRARDEIDAAGQVVAPGFIDTQGQSGRALLLDGAAESHVRQGITSEVIGEASTPGLWRADAAELEALRQKGIAFDWSGIGGFLDKLRTLGVAINVGTLVPVNQVRGNIIGMADRPPTDDERFAMRAQVADAMDQGALGLSSALIYPPGAFARTEELIDLARVAASRGGIYVSHVRGETDRLATAIDEALTVAREARLPLVIFHLKVAARSRWGSMDEVVATLDRARADGVDVSATQYPYTVAGTSLDACLPDWVLEGGVGAALRRLRQSQVQHRIRGEIEQGHDGWENFLRSAGFDGVTIANVRAGGDMSVVGHSLAAIAESRSQDPWEVFFSLLIEHRLQVSALYALMQEDDVRVAMRQPWISIGTDSAAQTDVAGQTGRPHPRAFGTFPRVFARYVRETPVLTLEQAVHKMTGLAARQMGIAGRGHLRPGFFADVVIFDPAAVADRATFEEPRQYPVGIDTVIVNGGVVVRRGVPTTLRPGRPLRGRAAGAEPGMPPHPDAGTL